MYRLYQKSMLYFSLAWIGCYIVLMSVGDSLSDSLGMLKAGTVPVCLVLALVIFAFVRKHGLLEQTGLCRMKASAGEMLWFLPLAVLLTANLWNGATLRCTPAETALYIISMLLVGFLEEVIFRGFLFTALRREMKLPGAILISSLTFGFGHIVNLLRGEALLATLLQLCYAAAIGLLFTVMFYKGKSIWPCIIAHGVFNALSIFAVEGSQTQRLITAVILCILPTAYAAWLWKKLPDPQ